MTHDSKIQRLLRRFNNAVEFFTLHGRSEAKAKYDMRFHILNFYIMRVTTVAIISFKNKLKVAVRLGA